MKELIESIRLNSEEYFEARNERLHGMLESTDECLNQASGAHSTAISFRSDLINACNDIIQPAAKCEDGDALVRLLVLPYEGYFQPSGMVSKKNLKKSILVLLLELGIYV